MIVGPERDIGVEREAVEGSAQLLYVARGGRERRLQKALVRWKDPANKNLVLEALEQPDERTSSPRS